jgi:hypothetical protein
MGYSIGIQSYFTLTSTRSSQATVSLSKAKEAEAMAVKRLKMKGKTEGFKIRMQAAKRQSALNRTK